MSQLCTQLLFSLIDLANCVGSFRKRDQLQILKCVPQSNDSPHAGKRMIELQRNEAFNYLSRSTQEEEKVTWFSLHYVEIYLH